MGLSPPHPIILDEKRERVLKSVDILNKKCVPLSVQRRGSLKNISRQMKHIFKSAK